MIIPQCNVHNLMLRKDIVEAVEKGDFNIWAIRHVTEAIEILIGQAAGQAGLDGIYPVDSVLGQAQLKLNALR